MINPYFFWRILKHLLLCLPLSLLFVYSGCKKAEVTTYTIPKESRPSPLKNNPSWKIPSDWQEQETVPPRKASYQVDDPQGRRGEVSVSLFPGEVGGLLANINRLRGQLGLEPVSQAAVDGLTEKVTVNGQETHWVDLQNDKERLLVVILMIEDNSWFFKFTGNLSLIEEQYANFFDFIHSIEF